MPKPKIIIIGLDAAVQSLLKPWVKQGKLPNLAALMAEGVEGPLESVAPPLTPAAWTTFMTGKNPGKHGIYNFMEPASNGYGMHYTNGGNRRAETLWHAINRAGMTVGVMNTPFTYPPEKVTGFQISGLDTPSSDSAFVHPPELKKEIEAKFGALQLDARYLGAMTNLKKRAEAVAEFKAADEQWSGLALYLLDNHPQDVMMFTFMTIDTVEHHFWHYMDDQHFYHDPEGGKLFRDVILETYQRLDQTVGEIVKRIDPTATQIFVVSDHGQEAVSDRTLHINRILSQAGLLVYKPEDQFKKLLFTVTKPVFGLLRKTLTHAQKAWLADIFPKLRDSAEGIVTSYNDIDWTKTKAYCHEAWATPPSVSINLKGVKPQGIVEEADYEALIQHVLAVLAAVKDPRTGQPVIAKAYRRDELYSGPYAKRSPDLTLKWWGESPFNTKPSLRSDEHLPPLIVEKPRPLTLPEWSGHHTLDGILIASGPGLKRGATAEGARLMDMAPTLLYLLNLPIPEDVDGKVLVDILQPSAQHESKFEAGQKEEEKSYEYSEDEAAMVEERLKNLGYME
jgi:predicted AlkP superfamily phosphohydrolase/phosphomutase